MSKQETSVYGPTYCEKQGEQANFDGEMRASNPYRDVRGAWWAAGWERAQAVRDEWEANNHARAVMYG